MKAKKICQVIPKSTLKHTIMPWQSENSVWRREKGWQRNEEKKYSTKKEMACLGRETMFANLLKGSVVKELCS